MADDFEMVIPRQMQEYMKMPKILPCPECFKRPRVIREFEDGKPRVSLVCSGSEHMVRTIGFHNTLLEAVEDWNAYVAKILEAKS